MTVHPIIGFAGMTHLGINSAAATAKRGFKVIGFDSNIELIKNFKKNVFTIVEPGLSELLLQHQQTKQLNLTHNIKTLNQCDIVYIASDVPTSNTGESDLSSIENLIQQVVQQLNPSALLIILCQVPPGFTRRLNSLIPLSRVYYQVETLIFGKAIERALYPERFIIGCYSTDLPLDARYHYLLSSFSCPILPMRYESAELAKISINCCLVASIGVANTLSEICEKIGADWEEIVPALKLDKRIGAHAYLTPGLGLAGGNLERDLTTVINLANQHGTDAGIVKSWVKNSAYRKNWVLKILHTYVFKQRSSPLLTILGLAYKENTHSIKNSPALALLESLQDYAVKIYDPAVDSRIVPWAKGENSVIDALYQADALIIMTPWSVFRDLTAELLKENMRGRIIIDPYGVFKKIHLEKNGFHYFTLGKELVC